MDSSGLIRRTSSLLRLSSIFDISWLTGNDADEEVDSTPRRKSSVLAQITSARRSSLLSGPLEEPGFSLQASGFIFRMLDVNGDGMVSRLDLEKWSAMTGTILHDDEIASFLRLTGRPLQPGRLADPRLFP